ncbi:MAG: ATP-binding protein [bacterium]
MDDNIIWLTILTHELEEEGYKVFTATNPTDALKILEKEEVDIVITDIIMPIRKDEDFVREAGRELLDEIKSKYPHIEVIISTVCVSDEIFQSCMRKGAFAFFRKPFSIEELVKSIEECVQHINLKKRDSLKAENIGLKRKVDFLTKQYDRLKQTSQQRIKDHPESMTLSEFGDIIAGITHSLTTEIGIINSTSEGLLDKKVEDDSNIKKYKRLSRSAKYCNVLLNNLRGLLLEGKPTPTETDIKKVLDDIISLFEYRIPSNVKLTIDIGPELPKLIIDKNQIEQVLVNVINNGIEAMPEGGELLIKAEKKGTNLNIEISDTGVGIPKGNLDNVFELYFSTKKRGAGLGLYLTKRIVERHNGSISVKTQEGKGTTMIISFPIAEEK